MADFYHNSVFVLLFVAQLTGGVAGAPVPQQTCGGCETGGRVKTAPHGDVHTAATDPAAAAVAIDAAANPGECSLWTAFPPPSRKNFYQDERSPVCDASHNPIHHEPAPSRTGGSDVDPCCALYCPLPKQGCCEQAHAPPRPCGNGACGGQGK